MARYAGTNLYMSFKNTAIQADYQALEDGREQKKTEVTAGADAHATYVKTYQDGTIKVELFDVTGGTAATAYKNLLAAGAEGTFIFGEEGTASGMPKHTIVAFVEKHGKKFKFDEGSKLTFELQPNAAAGWSDGTW